MNKLKVEKKEAVISALVEGNSIRSIERMTGIHRDTIMRLGKRVGDGCAEFTNEYMQDLSCDKIQVDEIWCFVGKKQRHLTKLDNPHQFGNKWTYVALDPVTKLVPSYIVGQRNQAYTNRFLKDLSSRMRNRVQLSSDAMVFYVDAVEAAFGANADYGQIVKTYESENIGPARYSPPKVVRADKEIIEGNPDLAHISTSLVERQNLTMRMSMRRFTRLTNAFSKKVDNLRAAVSLHFAHYNFVRIHGSLRMTPAMASGVTSELWSIRDLLEASGET